MLLCYTPTIDFVCRAVSDQKKGEVIIKVMKYFHIINDFIYYKHLV